MTAPRNHIPAASSPCSNAGVSKPLLEASATFRYQFSDCDTCEGGGAVSGVAHVRGEAYDADLYEIDCPDCGGTGLSEAACCGCLKVAPLDDDGECRDCASLFLNPVVLVGEDQRSRIEL